MYPSYLVLLFSFEYYHKFYFAYALNLKLKKCAILNRRISVMSLLTDRNALSQIERYFLKLLTFKLKRAYLVLY